MKNKVLVIGVIMFFIVSGSVFAFFRINNQKVNDTSSALTEENLSDSSAKTKQISQKFLIWNDPGGFSFSYPDGWLFDTHDQDITNYANITITKLGSSGGITILVSDAKYKTILDWTKKDSAVAGSSLMETTLGGVKAQKALLKSGEAVIGSIDQNVLYTITLKPDEAGYWKTEFDKLAASFKYVYPTNYPVKKDTASQSNPVSDTSGGIVEEAEEVIE